MLETEFDGDTQKYSMLQVNLILVFLNKRVNSYVRMILLTVIR